MLFCTQIKNFDDFNQRFGYKTDQYGNYLINRNGAKQRKNLIPYLIYKESFLYYRSRGYPLKLAFEVAQKINNNQEAVRLLIKELQFYGLCVNEEEIIIPSFKNYHIIGLGIPPNGDINSVYYQDSINGKNYPMKIGRYVQSFIDYVITQESKFQTLTIRFLQNPRLRAFLVEELTEQWKNSRLQAAALKVVVNQDFQSIYSYERRNKNNQNFNSCMDDKPNWKFYTNYPDIFKAVSLQDDSGNIYARALLIECQSYATGKKYQLLERIYCNKRMYKDLLFDKIKQLGICTLYKDLEASCRDSRSIKFINDDSLFKDYLYIPIEFKDQDICAYQDTFKFYYPALHKMYNEPIFRQPAVNLSITTLYYNKAWENN